MNNNLNPEDILVDESSENDLLEVPLTKKVFYGFAFVSLAIFLVITGKFLAISIGNSQIYTKSALANMTNTDIERAPRGVIKGKYGDDLVKNRQAYRVFLSLSDIPEDRKERRDSLQRISEALNISYEEISNTIENHDWALGRPLLKKNVTHGELVNLTSENLPGIDIEPGYKRVHQPELVFSHILGYTGLVTKSDIEENPEFSFENEIGKDGLELEYDNHLRGESGRKIQYVDALGNVEDELAEGATPGSDLKTYIDGDFQRVAYRRLSDQLRSIGSSAGAFLALNPQNGEVLSMVSIPSFDNNNVGGYLNSPSQPLFNRTVSGLYNPGSTIKPLVALAALEEGVVTPQDQFFSTGQLVVENPYNPDQPSIFKDWKQHGWVDMEEAIARSSNVYFYIVGGGHDANPDYGLYQDKSGLGISKLNEWWKKFRLDEPTLIDIPGENTGNLPNPEKKEKNTGDPWLLGNTYNVSIGQGNMKITPLGLLNYISAIANGGKINKLRIADKNPEVLSDLSDEISESSFETVRQGMVDAVEQPYGTAHSLNSLPMTSAGKTGSAQVGFGSTNAFFVGYAPADNPQIAVMVLIEGSKEGSLNAVPVARDLLDWYYYNRIQE